MKKERKKQSNRKIYLKGINLIGRNDLNFNPIKEGGLAI